MLARIILGSIGALVAGICYTLFVAWLVDLKHDKEKPPFDHQEWDIKRPPTR